MIVRWLSEALIQLDRVYEYISRENPRAAADVFVRIRKATHQLSRFPMVGRAGHVSGTRELVVTGLPYLVVYRVSADDVEILRVLHTAMDRPPLMQ
jgi:toxin ParE1/3/4